MIKHLIFILLLLIPFNSFSADEVISSFDEKNVSTLNEELRGLTVDNQIKKEGGLDLQSKTISNVAEPVASSDAATKNYIDSINTSLVARFNTSTGHDHDGSDSKKLSSTGISGLFGSWSSCNASQIYQATTDGIVMVGGHTGATFTLHIFTDGSTPPTTERAQIGGQYTLTLTCPVKKGDYWEATATGNDPHVDWVYWLPLGS
jgi:hypothetical protein